MHCACCEIAQKCPFKSVENVDFHEQRKNLQTECANFYKVCYNESMDLGCMNEIKAIGLGS